jgi:trk system potassium uptake protein TrkH
VAITTTLLLIIGGTLAILILEFNNPATLAPLGLKDKVMASYFQAVTPRTAGFNTLDIGKMFTPTLFLIMCLMFIGASPGGTGGGIKTTTLAIIIATIWATLKGSRNTVMYGRRIPGETVRRAFTIAFISLTVVAVAVFILDNAENLTNMALAFETFSALGTVGLSMGITPYLKPLSKIVIILVMFTGRVGPLGLLLALTMGQKEPRIEPPKEGISIG